MARLDEISAPSDSVIELRLKTPFALVPEALAQYGCAIMPERLAKTDANTQLTEVMGSGPFRFVAAERLAGSRVVFEKNPDYVPRPNGVPSFTAGPKVVHVDRVVWTFVPDQATVLAAMANTNSTGGSSRCSTSCRRCRSSRTWSCACWTTRPRSAACGSTSCTRHSTIRRSAAPSSRR